MNDLFAAGLHWNEGGTVALSGDLAEYSKKLDDFFLKTARQLGATEYQFSALIEAKQLQKIDYFRSFPHLSSFVTTINPQPDNLEAFVNGGAPDLEAALHLSKADAVQFCLTPAACYHFYIQLQNQSISEKKLFTTCCPCFRRESAYLPLQRQWSFHMREIVCLGSSEDIKEFVDTVRAKIDKVFASLDIHCDFHQASDPFFSPAANPKALLQKLDAAKQEMIFDKHLALGSINLHRNFFGEAFHISHEGVPAHSACIAFGLERWLFAFYKSFGPDLAKWPDLDALKPAHNAI